VSNPSTNYIARCDDERRRGKEWNVSREGGEGRKGGRSEGGGGEKEKERAWERQFVWV